MPSASAAAASGARTPAATTRSARPRPARPSAAPAVRRSAGVPAPTPTRSTVRAARSPGTSGRRVVAPASDEGSWAAATSPASSPTRASAAAASWSPARPSAGTGTASSRSVGSRSASTSPREVASTDHLLVAGSVSCGVGTVATLPTPAGTGYGPGRRDMRGPPPAAAGGGPRKGGGQPYLRPSQLSMASPSARTSSGVISTTRRPPPSRGMRSTMPRPSLVTSSGPSPVLGFIAAMGVSLPYGVVCCWARGSTPVLEFRPCVPDLLHYPVNLLTGEIRSGVQPRATRWPQGMMSGMTQSPAAPQPPHLPVVVEREGSVATVRLSRPEAMNSLDTPTKEALLAALTEVAADPTVRCVVLTGSGRAFCVGQDLKEHIRL